MGSLACNEFENLQKRHGAEYSLGHRLMYDTPITLLTGRKSKILDVGFGVGYGLDRMIAADIIDRYVGFEPNPDSFNYVKARVGHRYELVQEPFVKAVPGFDHVFCIEVIEHVEMDKHARFLSALRSSTVRTLWLSTPDVRNVPSEGVRMAQTWKTMLNDAGFNDVTVHTEQWTVLFIAQ